MRPEGHNIPKLPSTDALSSVHPLRCFVPLIREWATDAMPKEVARYLHVHFPSIDVNYRGQSTTVPWGCTFDQQWTEMWAEIGALQRQDTFRELA